MKKALVIVDMQNDFVTGVFANPIAESIAPYIREYAMHFDGDIFFTQDTHLEPMYNVAPSIEEVKLPAHCIFQSAGWDIVPELKEIKGKIKFITKSEFGSFDLASEIESGDYDEVQLCGVCTDICVLSNVVTIQTIAPCTKVVVLENLCAGSSEEAELAAFTVMEKSLLVELRTV